MAKIGLLYPKYCPITISQDESGKDKETYGEIKLFAKAIRASTSLNISQAELYTDDEYDAIFDDLCSALSDIGAAWVIRNIGYDDSVGQIVYEVAWEVPCGSCSIYR